jgi:hypothetical protein
MSEQPDLSNLPHRQRNDLETLRVLLNMPAGVLEDFTHSRRLDTSVKSYGKLRDRHFNGCWSTRFLGFARG